MATKMLESAYMDTCSSHDERSRSLVLLKFLKFNNVAIAECYRPKAESKNRSGNQY